MVTDADLAARQGTRPTAGRSKLTSDSGREAIWSKGRSEEDLYETSSDRPGVGCADRPLSNGEVVAKFFDNADRAVPRRAAEHIRDAVLDFDRENARSLADALCATS